MLNQFIIIKETGSSTLPPDTLIYTLPYWKYLHESVQISLNAGPVILSLIPECLKMYRPAVDIDALYPDFSLLMLLLHVWWNRKGYFTQAASRIQNFFTH